MTTMQHAGILTGTLLIAGLPRVTRVVMTTFSLRNAANAGGRETA